MSRRGAVAACAGTVAVALGAAAVYGPGYLGYDAAWALVWGGELRSGRIPSYEAPVAPTPHPLLNLMAVPLSALPDDGAAALAGLAYLGLAVVIVAGAWLAAGVGGRRAALTSGLLLGGFAHLGRSAGYGSVDVWFVASVTMALALSSRRQPGHRAPLLLLTAAGLLRPEGWLLAGAFVAWVTVRQNLTARRAAGLAAIAAAAPVLWLLSDLIVTGDLLHSLHGTRALAADLERPRGTGVALGRLTGGIGDLIGVPAALTGFAALVLLTYRDASRVGPVAGALAITLCTFLLIGVSGLAVLDRYLALPATLLLIALGASTGLMRRGSGRATSPLWFGAGMVASAAVLATLATTPSRIADARDLAAARGAVLRDLAALVRSEAFSDATDRCPRIRIPDYRARPVILLAHASRRPVVEVGFLPDGTRGLLLTYTSRQIGTVLRLSSREQVRRQARPVGGREIAVNRSWRVIAVC